MGLRLLGLWNVVFSLSAVVIAAQNCSTPDIENGFFISEQSIFPHNTELYYGCDVNFKPVEGSWWASVICQNGNWSSLPQCIEDTACIEPEIPNANPTGFQYVKHNEKIWIRCNTGYEDKKNRATALCENGQWTELPVCEKINNWCGPPPQMDNAVIIDRVYQDLFSEDTSVVYMCKSGFEIETGSKNAFCSQGQWLTPSPCRKKQTNSEPTLSTTTASPVSTGSDDTQHMFTTIDRCGTPPIVKDGEVFYDEHNMFVTYKCNYWYKLNGNRKVRCFNQNWTPVPTCEVNFCKLGTSRYDVLKNIGDVFIKHGTKVKLECADSSWRKAHAVCQNNQLFLSECCLGITHSTRCCGYRQINTSQ